MTWAPGSRVLTVADLEAWKAWRKERKRQQQRDRRARYARIDYYPDAAADVLIRSLSGRFVGGDLSSVINRIVAGWASRCDARPSSPGKDAWATVPPE